MPTQVPIYQHSRCEWLWLQLVGAKHRQTDQQPVVECQVSVSNIYCCCLVLIPQAIQPSHFSLAACILPSLDTEGDRLMSKRELSVCIKTNCHDLTGHKCESRVTMFLSALTEASSLTCPLNTAGFVEGNRGIRLAQLQYNFPAHKFSAYLG